MACRIAQGQNRGDLVKLGNRIHGRHQTITATCSDCLNNLIFGGGHQHMANIGAFGCSQRMHHQRLAVDIGHGPAGKAFTNHARGDDNYCIFEFDHGFETSIPRGRGKLAWFLIIIAG